MNTWLDISARALSRELAVRGPSNGETRYGDLYSGFGDVLDVLRSAGVDLSSVNMADLLRQELVEIRIDTVWGPPLKIKDPLAPGPPNPYLQAMKPKITLVTKNFGPLEMKPYGEPGASRWGEVTAAGGAAAAGLAVVGSLLAYKLWKGW